MADVEFPDLSHFNSPLSLAGVGVVFAKATQGRSYVDPAYSGFKAQAAARGALFVAYHWLDTTDPVGQAEHCFSIVGPHTPLMIDDEQQRIVVSHTLAFVVAYRKLGGWLRFEYGPRWAWQAGGEPDLRPLAEAGLLLVSSAYVPSYSPNGPGWAGYGGVTPTIWQWTDHHLFNGKFVDFNAYRGTVAQLRALTVEGGTMALTQADADLVVTTLLKRGLGSSGVPTVGLALQDGYNTTKTTAAEVASDVTRDAAVLAAVQALAAGGGVDAAPIVAAVHDEANKTRQLVLDLQSQVVTLQAANAALREQLAAGAKANADALQVPGT